MDPNSGRLFPTIEAAHLAGVEHPIHITGRQEDIDRLSTAVADLHRRELTSAQKAAKKARRKAAKAARRNNR